MTPSEALTLYVERARAAGAEVEVFSARELPARLDGLLAATGARAVAVPATGWPPGLREVVAASLRRGGCQEVSPALRGRAYAWDRAALAAARLGITFCDGFVADTGSLVVPSGAGLGTLASLLPWVHLALSRPEGCHESLEGYLGRAAGALPSRLTFVTGPSRTGDIEATMTQGVHGPGRVLHWILAGPGPLEPAG
ncbi:MAG: LUD domain-containing protein [Deltaproteobacteria bacterium]|nr:LUD domain-containing protein [Deltaproteobacteria bacterium]